MHDSANTEILDVVPGPSQSIDQGTNDTANERPISHCQALWAKMLAEKRLLLVRAGVTNILDFHDVSAMQSGVESLQSKTRKSRVTRTLLQLDHVVERLKLFVGVISTFIQSDPTYSALIWGGLLVCLECFSSSNRALKAISNHFNKMATAMPRFEIYMELYPKNEGLERVLLGIYGSFVDTCILSIKIFQRKSWWRPAASILSSVSHKFEDTCTAIKHYTEEFEREARLVHDIAVANHHQQFTLHQRLIEEALLPVTISARSRDSLFSVPFPQNPGFVGQENELDTLLANLTHGSQLQKSCVIQGIGGVGKTHLALEFCYRSREQFPFILWVAAQNDVSLSASYTKIATLLSLQDEEKRSSSLVIDTTRRWLYTGWLLIFDNVDSNDSVLNEFWPPCQHGSIILTSQRADLAWRTRSSFLRLEPLSESYGSELLLRNYSNHSDDFDPKLAKEISKESFVSLEDTLEMLRRARGPSEWHFPAEVAFQYERPIQLVFQLSFDRLPEAAKQVISIMSMFSPTDIPESLIKAKPRTGGDDTQAKNANYKIWFATTIRQSLCSRHLTDIRQRHGNSEWVYSMHRSVQLSILDMLNDEMRQHAFNEGVKILQSQLPKPSTIMVPKLTGFDRFDKYIPHVISIHDAFVKYRSQLIPTVSFAEMLCSAAAYLYEVGLASLCLKVATTGEAVCQRLAEIAVEGETGPCAPTATSTPILIFDTNYLPMSQSLTTLAGNISAYGAGVLWTTGGIVNRKQGHNMTWRVLKLREKHIKSTDENRRDIDCQHLLSNAYNDWALQLINEGRYSEAKFYSDRSLEMKLQLLHGNDNQFQFFISKILLAHVLASAGHSQGAISTAEEAIAHIESEKGRDDPFTLCYQFYVAHIWAIVGNHPKALELLKTSLNARIRLFGETNHNSLNGHLAVAICLYRLRKYAEARAYLDRCLERAEAVRWGREHILRAEYLQSLIMQCMGDRDADWKSQENAALNERNALLREHATGKWAAPASDVEEMVYFDHLVNFHAGRTSAVDFFIDEGVNSRRATSRT
ncbi:hypothetical protein PT974_09436 [Cladobotryum mycophilum]|uniref:NB-ARC domain-containing protein n=1 Tax=Cladobotryum mycophilum TaxID=491253 RepID=A0ABR0SG76_9HYPO